MTWYAIIKERWSLLRKTKGAAGLFPIVLVLFFLPEGCGEGPAHRDTPSALAPQGEGAHIIAAEWWFQFTLGTVIFILIIVLLGYVVARRRQPASHNIPDVDLEQSEKGMSWIWGGGVILPIIILTAVFAVSLSTLRAHRAVPESDELLIEVIGHQWWWEVHYPQHGIVTANQVAAPVGTAVQIEVTSADVIHSFWVPQLQYKVDLIPGRVNSTWIQANEPGVYRGLCAEFCGVQHANMHLLFVAMPPDRFEMWLEQERSPAVPPTDPLAIQGQEVFLSSSCVYCHQIRGTPAAGSAGPDLTHMGSRFTLGAGILRNNPGNMGAWISDPQHIKPGVYMPATPLTGYQMQSLLAYLESLE